MSHSHIHMHTNASVPMPLTGSFTGRQQVMFSSLQNRFVTYDESYTIRVTTPQPYAPDVESMRNTLNAQFLSGTPESGGRSVDAQCDSIVVMQGIVTDQYKYRTWIAEEQPNQPAMFILPVVWAAIIIAIAITAVLVGVGILAWAFITVATPLLPSKPKYIGGTPDNPVEYDDWSEYISGQGVLYWYVCPKCGAGYGLKTSYPLITDVPEAEVLAFEEHKAQCLALPKTLTDVWPLLLWGTFGIVAFGFTLYSLPRIFSSARGTR